jgi:hypothetical protein
MRIVPRTHADRDTPNPRDRLPDEPSTRAHPVPPARRDWRIPTGLAAGALLALVLACWPLRAPVAALLERVVVAYGDLLAGAVVLALLLALAGGVGIVFALRRRIAYQAEQAAVVRAPNAMPMHVADLRRISTTQLLTTIERFYANQDTWAQHSTLRNVQTYGPTVSYRYDQRVGGPAPLAPAPAVSDDAVALPPFAADQPLLPQLRARGHICRSGQSLLVGYHRQQPCLIDLAACGFIGVGGQSRSGKSATVLSLVCQAALLGWHVAVIDPHLHKEDGLLRRAAALSGRLFKQAVTPEEALRVIGLVDKIGRRRVSGLDPDRTRILFVFDEFSNFMLRGWLPDETIALLIAIGQEYPGVGIHGLFVGHDWNGNLISGRYGAPFRRTFTHRIVHRCAADAATFLLPAAALAGQVPGLETGTAFVLGPEEPAVVRVPYLGAADVVYAAQGTPPRPYQPWGKPAAPAAGLTPPRSVPPTTPLQPPTLADHILALVQARGSLLGTEIVATIVATIGADRVAAFNELTFGVAHAAAGASAGDARAGAAAPGRAGGATRDRGPHGAPRGHIAFH